MTESETLQWIHSMPRFHNEAGLARIRRLLAFLGNPQRRLRFIHVAGTNGKGSTCAMTASILRAAGYRTGLYISPYIRDFRERMQVNGRMIPRRALCRIAAQLRPEVDAMCAEGCAPAEFELVTAIAMQWFDVQRCSVVVLEVGLGGRLDATNVIDPPLASVICAIGRDHTELLGATEPEIAREKCGIIKRGSRTFCAPQPEEVRAVIESAARAAGNPFEEANVLHTKILRANSHGTRFTFRGQTYRLSMLGGYQLRNAVTVLTTLDGLRRDNVLQIPDFAMHLGLRWAHFPARMEVMQRRPLVLLDGAHNPQGLHALALALRQYPECRRCIVIMGMLRDKDYADGVKALLPSATEMLTLTPDSPRALDAETLAETIRAAGGKAQAMTDPAAAIARAKELAGRHGAVAVCGSLYLAAQLRPMLKKCRWH